MGLIPPPPAPPAILDLLTGDDSQFTSSVGAWTNTGGTLSRDTTSAYRLKSFAASLKYVTTATSQHADVPVAGTFLAGVRYDFLAMLKIEETAGFGVDELDLILGLQGTDTTTVVFNLSDGLGCAGSAGYFYPLYGVWTPSANRTGVTLRLNRTAASLSVTSHLGLVRVARIANAGDVGLGLSQNPVAAASYGELIAAQPSLSWGGTDNAGDTPTTSIFTSPVSGGEWSQAGIFNLPTSTTFEDALTLPDNTSGGQIMAGTVDPTAGGGVAHDMPALYLRDNSGTTELWTPTGAGATQWQKVTIP